MHLCFYADENFPAALTYALRKKGVDVLTVQEDEAWGRPDPQVLDRATFLGRVLVTLDYHFEVEAARRQRLSIPFTAVIRVGAHGVVIGSLARDLELVTKVLDPEQMRDLVEHVPL